MTVNFCSTGQYFQSCDTCQAKFLRSKRYNILEQSFLQAKHAKYNNRNHQKKAEMHPHHKD